VFPASQVFLVRKVVGKDSGTLYAMKVLKKATLKGSYDWYSLSQKMQVQLLTKRCLLGSIYEHFNSPVLLM
jgi:hypothetical protein